MCASIWLTAVVGLAAFAPTKASSALSGQAVASGGAGALVVLAIGQWPPRVLVEKRMSVNETRCRSGKRHPLVLRPFNHRHAVAWGALIGVAFGLIALAAAQFIRHR